MDDKWWLEHGVAPFPGPVDDWPAERADNLQTVIGLQEQVKHNLEHEAQSQAQYEQWRASRGRSG